jgi:hypothetical protein
MEMQPVTDPELIKKLDAERIKKTVTEEGVTEGRKAVTDPELIKKLDANRSKKTTEGGFFSSIGDFFTGTKRTEYPDLPEIGDLDKGVSEMQKFKIATGLLLTPSQNAQLEIVQTQVPGTSVLTDKFDNPIVVFPDGQSFYLNKPGASLQDVVQTTSQMLQYMGAFGAVAKKFGGSLLQKVVTQGAAGAGVSVAQDLAAMQLGAKEIDTTKAVVSAVIPMVFEGASPLVRAVLPKLFKNPVFSTVDDATGEIILTEKGKKAAQAAGIDLSVVNQDFIRNFTRELGRGSEARLASQQAGAGQFNFKLSRGQAMGDDEAVASLFEAAKGSFGPENQTLARNFLKQQNIDIETSAKGLLDRFNKGDFEIETLEGAGQVLFDSLKRNFRKASDKVETAYNLVDKDAVYTGSKSNIQVLNASTQKAVQEATNVVSPKLTPSTIESFKVINNFVNKVKKGVTVEGQSTTKNINPTFFNDFETTRKTLSNLIQTSANKTDKRNTLSILKEFDKVYDDAIDNALFGSGNNPNALKAIFNARETFKNRQKLFGINDKVAGGLKIKDNAGKVINKILEEADVTPLKTINYIFGQGQLGLKNESLTIVKRLKDIFGVEGKDLGKQASTNADFQALRTATFDKLIADSVKNNKFSPESFVKQWETVSVKNKYLLNELFTQPEIKLIDTFVKEVRKTFVPKDLMNYSNTASALARLTQYTGRALAGIVGFKLANIQGLLAARGAVDNARNIFSEKAAKKLISKEISSDLNYIDPGSRNILGGVIGTVQEILGQTEKIGAPRVPLGLFPSSQPQPTKQEPRTEVPILDRNVMTAATTPTAMTLQPTDRSQQYAGLFPFDVTGQQIARQG